MNTPYPETKPPKATGETLRLKCPTCGGGLNLKRQHLGLTGQCVHCQTPLTALERDGFIQVVAGLDPHFVSEVPEVLAASAPPVENAVTLSFGQFVEATEQTVVPRFHGAPPLETVDAASALPDWGFPNKDHEPAGAQALQALLMEEETPLSILSSIEPKRDLIPATTKEIPQSVNPLGSSNLLVAPGESLATSPLTAPAFNPAALFGDQTTNPKESFSSMFKNADDSSEINPAWGTKVPQEGHASISPFSTGSASGGGFAESLFREKVIKEPEKIESPLFASPFGRKEDSPPLVPPAKEEFQKKVVLDGDGRPMKPMTPEEEANFAKHLFAVEKTHKRPRWVKKLIKTAITFGVLGAIGTGVYFLTPEEKLAQWKEKAYVWLEPGLAILDYVPQGLRPDWLPRTSLGIDAGVDENGVPKKKLNAFEGLDKLKGDIGNMRGTAEDELENINKL